MVHGTFCAQPWPVDGPEDDVDQFCAVANGDLAHTAHTVRLPDVLRRCNLFHQSGKVFFPCFGVSEEFTKYSGVTSSELCFSLETRICLV